MEDTVTKGDKPAKPDNEKTIPFVGSEAGAVHAGATTPAGDPPKKAAEPKKAETTTAPKKAEEPKKEEPKKAAPPPPKAPVKPVAAKKK